MPDFDPFDLFRWILATIATIYATIVTLQSMWEWYAFLSGGDRYVSLLRRYVILHGLRLRFKTFWGDAIICLLLCVAFVILWQAHNVVFDIDATFRSVAQQAAQQAAGPEHR